MASPMMKYLWPRANPCGGSEGAKVIGRQDMPRSGRQERARGFSRRLVTGSRAVGECFPGDLSSVWSYFCRVRCIQFSHLYDVLSRSDHPSVTVWLSLVGSSSPFQRDGPSMVPPPTGHRRRERVFISFPDPLPQYCPPPPAACAPLRGPRDASVVATPSPGPFGAPVPHPLLPTWGFWRCSPFY